MENVHSTVNMKTREISGVGTGSSAHGGISLLSLNHSTWELYTWGRIVEGVGMGPKDMPSIVCVPYSDKLVGV